MLKSRPFLVLIEQSHLHTLAVIAHFAAVKSHRGEHSSWCQLQWFSNFSGRCVRSALWRPHSQSLRLGSCRISQMLLIRLIWDHTEKSSAQLLHFSAVFTPLPLLWFTNNWASLIPFLLCTTPNTEASHCNVNTTWVGMQSATSFLLYFPWLKQYLQLTVPEVCGLTHWHGVIALSFLLTILIITSGD